MLIPELLEVEEEISYHSQEKLANNIVKHLAETEGMTYRQAYNIIMAHKKVFEEAVSHLNHNAAMQKADDIIDYVLE